MAKYKLPISIVLIIFALYMLSPIRFFGGLLEKDNIPKNFLLGETLYYGISPGCLIVAYQVINFSDEELISDVIKYQPFFTGKNLQYYLDHEINPNLMVGNAALTARDCIKDPIIKQAFVRALNAKHSIFTYSNNGSRLLAYNRRTNILYYATW